MDPKPIPTPQAISVGTGCCKAAAETLAKAPLPPLEASCSACRHSLGGERRHWEPQVESGCCKAARSIWRNLFSRSLKGRQQHNPLNSAVPHPAFCYTKGSKRQQLEKGPKSGCKDLVAAKGSSDTALRTNPYVHRPCLALSAATPTHCSAKTTKPAAWKVTKAPSARPLPTGNCQ